MGKSDKIFRIQWGWLLGFVFWVLIPKGESFGAPNTTDPSIQAVIQLGQSALGGQFSPSMQAEILQDLVRFRRHQNFGDRVGLTDQKINELDSVIAKLYSAIQVEQGLSNCEKSAGHYAKAVKEAANAAPVDPIRSCVLAQAPSVFTYAQGLKETVELGLTSPLTITEKDPIKPTLPRPAESQLRKGSDYKKGSWILGTRNRPYTPEEKQKLYGANVARFELREKLFYQSLLNSLKTNLDLSVRYPKSAVIADAASLAGHIEAQLTRVCGDRCSIPHRDQLRIQLNDYAKSIPKESESSISILNRKIEKLNEPLKRIRGFSCQPGQAMGPEQEATYQEYQARYRELASNDVGTLMLTDELKSGVEENPGKYRGPPSQRMREGFTDRGKHHRASGVKGNACPALHHPVDSTRFKDAIDEAKEKSRKHLDAIMEVAKSTDWDQSTRDLFRYNPVALGQILAEEPEYSAIACKELNAVKARDDRSEDLIKNAMWGGMIVGGALLVPLGVGLAAGSATLLATVGSGGMVLGGAATATSAASAFYYHDRLKSIESQLISGQGTGANTAEAQRINDEYEDWLKKTMLAGAFSAVDGVAVLKLLKSGGTVKSLPATVATEPVPPGPKITIDSDVKASLLPTDPGGRAIDNIDHRLLDAIVPPKPEEWMKVFPHTNTDLFLLERYPFEQVEKVLRRALTDSEKNALESAHLYGLGQTGKNGKLAHSGKVHYEFNSNGDFTFLVVEDGNFVPAQLAEKLRILKKGGFKESEANLLIRSGFAGVPEQELPEVLQKLGFGYVGFKNNFYRSLDDLFKEAKQYQSSAIIQNELKSLEKKFGVENQNWSKFFQDPKKTDALFEYFSEELPKKYGVNNPYNPHASDRDALLEYGSRSVASRGAGGPCQVLKDGTGMCSDLSFMTHALLSEMGIESKMIAHYTEAKTFAESTGHMALKVSVGKEDWVIDPNRKHIWAGKPGAAEEPTVVRFEEWKNKFTFQGPFDPNAKSVMDHPIQEHLYDRFEFKVFNPKVQKVK